jgi:hypothetical protein
MERISQVQLNNVLMAHDANSPRSLSNEDLSILLAEMDVLARRYTSQDQGESIEAYQEDLEALALKFSLPRVIAALRELRITSGQNFFPRPDEVAALIERAEESRRHERAMATSQRRRQADIDHFWRWIDEQLADNPAMSEQELLDSIKVPGYTGIKARQK